MLRLIPSLLAVALVLSSAPARAEGSPPLARPAAAPRAAPVPLVPQSSSAVTGGIFLVSFGVSGLVMGTSLDLAGRGDCSGSFSPFGAPPPNAFGCENLSAQFAGMSILIGSALLTGAGVALWIYGADPVPKLDRTLRPAARRSLLALPGAASLRWSF